MKRVQEAVVFEASPAEESVEGVQRLLPLHRLGKGSVQVGCAEWGQLHWAGGLEEVLILFFQLLRGALVGEHRGDGCKYLIAGDLLAAAAAAAAAQVPHFGGDRKRP